MKTHYFILGHLDSSGTKGLDFNSMFSALSVND